MEKRTAAPRESASLRDPFPPRHRVLAGLSLAFAIWVGWLIWLAIRSS